ncbi:hypothetical protein [Streptomyces sp. NBC_01233]|uniref:hypothetical protein n=1 Tax=Streptomyces sp. NBC_01233 TaxID=2903787 RepID=UPI002E0E3B5E|nr:hypothetical protein OG332_05185 [Streptomyces sp. NBC_01233]
MSRTPPARPYPRTTSSPDCADPPVRPGSKAHRPHGPIERARELPAAHGPLRERWAAVSPDAAALTAVTGLAHTTAVVMVAAASVLSRSPERRREARATLTIPKRRRGPR